MVIGGMMAETPPPYDPEMHRIIGAVLGAVAGLLHTKPINIRDALARGVFSMIAGYGFYFVALEFFGWDYTKDRVIGAALLVAFVSWHVAGGVIRWAVSKTAKY
jgi:hypothetical protein